MNLGAAIPPELFALGVEKSTSAINSATANAEQMAGAGGPTTTVTLDNSSGSTDAFTPSLPGCNTIKTLYRTNILNLDITDGFLKQLPVYKGYVTSDTTNSNAEVTSPNFKDIPMNVFAGIRNRQDIVEAGDSTSQLTDFDTWTGDQELAYYPWNRWLGSKIQLKDFMFIVERDSSGGLQMLNDPKFEIFFMPSNPGVNDDSRGTTFPSIPEPFAKYNGHRFLTNFDQGLDIEIRGRSGWGAPSDMYTLNTVTTAPYVRYYNFREWIQNSVSNQANNNGYTTIPRCMQLDTPLFFVAFRWINRLVQTNIKVTMSYSVQIESTWEGMFKNIHYDAFYMSQPGYTNDTEPMFYAKNKKRKLKQIE